jgi:hypothetical protein
MCMQVIVRQISGLGNQLFQYAAGRYYANRYGAELRIAREPAHKAISHGYSRPFLLEHFSINEPVNEISAFERLVLTEKPSLVPTSVFLQRTMRIRVFREHVTQRYTFLPDSCVDDEVRQLYLVGYWQAYRYVEEIACELRKKLSFRQAARGMNEEVLSQIKQNENSVSVHVRRGDFTLAVEGNIALPINYYTRAISIFRERLINPKFFIFFDDMAFAKQHLPHNDTVFVEHNDSSSSHEDLRLMSSCRHHIIANSTFSWWGAWLNPNPEKIVIAPKHWHQTMNSYYPGLLLPNWVLVDVLFATSV